MLAVLLTWFWFAGGKVISAGDIQGIICSPTPALTPSAMCLEDIPDWQNILTVDQLRNGRKGTALIAICWYCLHVFTTLVICDWTAEDVKTDVARQAEHEKVTTIPPPLIFFSSSSSYLISNAHSFEHEHEHTLSRNCWNEQSD